MLARTVLLLASALLLTGCSLRSATAPTPAPTATATSAWQTLADGMAWRTLIPQGDELAQIVVIRVDPRRFRFRAIYREGDPQSLADWRTLENDASLIVNANFFDQHHRVLGALVSDGIRYGAAYTDRGGSFTVRDGAPAVAGPQAQIDGWLEKLVLD